MSRVRKGFIKVLVGLFICFVLFCMLGIHYTNKYVNNVPKLTPKKEVYIVSPKESYKASDFVDVECVGEYDLYLLIEETDIPSAKLLDTPNGGHAGETLYVGDTKGSIRLSVQGYGKESEPGEPVTISLMVE